MKLTKYESKFLTIMAGSDFTGDGDAICDWLYKPDYEKDMGISMNKIRGVISSLIKKGILHEDEVSKQEDGFGNNWIYVDAKYTKMYDTECGKYQYTKGEFVGLTFDKEVI